MYVHMYIVQYAFLSALAPFGCFLFLRSAKRQARLGETGDSGRTTQARVLGPGPVEMSQPDYKYIITTVTHPPPLQLTHQSMSSQLLPMRFVLLCSSSHQQYFFFFCQDQSVQGEKGETIEETLKKK